ncbi:MAG TPA: hypothetical protein VF487_03660 [Chitinophagaceae bacterium]
MLPLIQKARTTIMLAVSVVACVLFSFTTKPGGEGFEIYLNNKLVMQRFNSQVNTVQTLQLDPSYANAQLSIKYFHCGKVGKNRSITIKDGQNKILKEWHFTDVSAVSSPMSCSVKDILTLKKTSSVMNLYYASSELPAGRQLAAIVIGSTNTAALTAK